VLAASGAARAYPYRPQTQHAALIAQLADLAHAQHRGLWGPPCLGDSFG
jgi:endonuclease YncB( thermonuclease family)